jgi:tetratricopeptide (TPR) repeat protein
MARRHFESGVAYYEQAEYEEALRAFEKAYELSSRPELLINVANVQERLGRLDQAIAALEKFLASSPEAELAETTRLRLETLRKKKDEQETAAVAPGPGPAPAPPETPAERAESAPPTTAAEPPAESNRIPAYVLFGVAGATAAGSLVTGLLASSEHSDAEQRCSPGCTDEELASGRALSITSTVLTGVAVVAAGVGAVLFFNGASSEGATEGRSGAGPTLSLDLAPASAAARARWRF